MVKIKPMKHTLLTLLLLISLPLLSQDTTDYYQSNTPCTCPYERKTTFMQDLWYNGIVVTARSLWIGIVKPSAASSAVGALQSTYSDNPLAGAVAGGAAGVAMSRAHRSRNRSSKNTINTEAPCTCNPCAYHGTRSFTPRHQQ